MRKVVFSFVKIYENSMVASVRIAKMISKELKLPLITEKEISDVKSPLDLLIIVNGAYAFCRCLPKLGALIRTARRVVWAQNDYTIIPPPAESGAESPFRKAFRERHASRMPGIDYWTTIGPNSTATLLSSYVNWNCLTFDLEAKDNQILKQRKDADNDLFYYGSFRDQGGMKSRRVEFDRYFTDPVVPVTVSSPGLRGVNKFEKYYPKCTHVPKIEGSLSPELVKHGLGLYIEDKMSHSEFHSPANRFYEMLSAGLPMVFQPECGSTMRKAGYNPEPWFVERSRHVAMKMSRKNEILIDQRKEWLEKARGERENLPNQLKNAMEKMEDQLEKIS